MISNHIVLSAETNSFTKEFLKRRKGIAKAMVDARKANILLPGTAHDAGLSLSKPPTEVMEPPEFSPKEQLVFKKARPFGPTEDNAPYN